MDRIPELDLKTMSADQRRVYDAIMAGPRGAVRGPLRIWLHNVELAENAQALGAYCRYGTSLPPRLSELAILITAASWRAGYEWHSHAPIAISAGLPEAVAEALRTGETPRFEREDEAAVHAFATELLEKRRVSDATWNRAQAALGSHAVLDLVGLLGYYALISMTLNAYEVAVPPGSPDPFATTSSGPRTSR